MAAARVGQLPGGKPSGGLGRRVEVMAELLDLHRWRRAAGKVGSDNQRCVSPV